MHGSVIVCLLYSSVKLTEWKTSTTHNNKMRQEDIEYRKKGGEHSTKNPIPTQEFKSKPNAFTISFIKLFGIVISKLWHDSSGVGLYFGCQNIPSKAK